MFRLISLTLVVGLLAGACGSGSPGGAGTGVAEVAAVIGSAPPTSTADGVLLPDLSLTLADGSAFDLARIDTPVLMVFWAEW